MCKIAAVNKISMDKRALILPFMKYLGQLMSINNADGLGYSSIDFSSNLHGERWLDNKKAFIDIKTIKHLYERPEKNYNWFGSSRPDLTVCKALTLHTRFATCGGELENNHPFVDNPDDPKFSLIHNGVIYNDHKFSKKFSTCDSEILLWNYLEHGVDKDIKNVEKMFEGVDGWWTICVLGKNDFGAYLDIITDNAVRIASAWVPELRNLVFSTSILDIEKTCKFFDYDYHIQPALKGNTIYRSYILTDNMKPTNYTFKTKEKKGFVAL